MDQGRFDSLARSLATAKTRRGVIGSLAVLGAGLLGIRSIGAQVSQVDCGNQFCASNPGGCNPGCVCCVYTNSVGQVTNSRCRPPGTCAPGTQVGGPTTTPRPTTTTARPTTTIPPTTTSTTTSTTSTTTTVRPTTTSTTTSTTSTTTSTTTQRPTTTTTTTTTLAPNPCSAGANSCVGGGVVGCHHDPGCGCYQTFAHGAVCGELFETQCSDCESDADCPSGTFCGPTGPLCCGGSTVCVVPCATPG